MPQILLVVIGILLSTSVLSAELPQNCLYVCPKAQQQQSQIIHRPIYSLSYNPVTKFAHWVAYRVTKKTIGKGAKRRWRQDPDLRPGTALSPGDFKRAHAQLGTDRGHLVPLASFGGTGLSHLTNYLSNITPQKSALNQGPWLDLEKAVRRLAKQARTSAVWVAAGPLFERPMPRLPATRKSHAVPSGYWKVIATDGDAGWRLSAFIFDQNAHRQADYCAARFRSTLSAVEARSKIDLFGAADEVTQSLDAALGCAD